jgi:hypothetical protein
MGKGTWMAKAYTSSLGFFSGGVGENAVAVSLYFSWIADTFLSPLFNIQP